MDSVIEKHNGWAELILNRPERRNAITGPLGTDLGAGLRELDADQSVNVILFRGAEGAFCSGLDLKEFRASPAPDWLKDFPVIWRSVHTALYNCTTPIICAMERFAINAGAALAIACDFLITGEKAFLEISEAKMGMIAAYNIAWLSLRHSQAAGMHLLLTGRRFAGNELSEMGIAQEVVADENVLSRATEMAEALSAFPAGYLGANKRVFQKFNPLTADEWFDRAFA
jgi:enoyl-CoA hydratase/carnithine racemase